MGTFIHALQVGYEVLMAIETVIAGGVGSVPFSWKGQTFIINITQAPKI